MQPVLSSPLCVSSLLFWLVGLFSFGSLVVRCLHRKLISFFSFPPFLPFCFVFFFFFFFFLPLFFFSFSSSTSLGRWVR